MKKTLLSTLLILVCSMAFSQLTLTSIVTNVSCNGAADGSATVTATGGVPPYTYTWIPFGGVTNPSSGLPAGTYSVIVMDAMGATNVLPVTVLQPPMLNIVMSQTNTTCYGTCDGAINLIATGGTPAYTYSWSNGSMMPQQTTLCAGVYSLIVTDSKGCTSSIIDTITSGPNPNITVNSGAFCSGSGSATLIATGANSYTWTPAIGLSSTSGPSVNASPLATTIYTVSGSIGSCVSTASAVVMVYPSPTISFYLTQDATPHVWDVTLNYSGGSAPYNYVWSWGDGSPVSTLHYASHTYTNAGWYNICATISDMNGCVATICQNDSIYRMSSSSSMIAVQVINSLTTNINKNAVSNNFISIYPNPTKYILNINLDEVKENTEINIYNTVGKLVLTECLKDSNTLININNLESGSYFYHILIREKSIKTDKLIIIK